MVRGRVTGIESKQTSTGKTVFTLHVDGKRYSAGFDKPKCMEGDIVEFDTTINGQYTNANTKTLKVLPPDAAMASMPKAASVGSSFVDRQDTISRQAASNTALQFVQLLAAQGALDIKASAKAAEKIAALEALVEHYTIFFYEQNTGNEYKSITPAHTEAMERAASSTATEWE